MVTRTISGVVGLAVLILTLAWPQYFSVPSGTLIITGSGFMTAIVLTFGVYLLFYALTGDWLPKFRKQNHDN
jgi:formate-dependent nitrite reductase membrane component NrfD